MSAVMPLAAIDAADTIELERARIGAFMRKIYRAAGLNAAIRACQGELLSLTEQVRDDHGPLQGWIA